MQLGAMPRVRLAHLPTPLEETVNLRRALGGGPRLFFKRDDATGLALGGNKARKLEFLVADALAKGADTLITTGGAQSNHARMTAAAANRFGLKTVLVLTGSGAAPRQGNLLMDHVLGAEVRFTTGEAAAAMEEVAAGLSAQGKRPYIIPIGGSHPMGALGYVACVQELAAQAFSTGVRVDHIVMATGSGGYPGRSGAGRKALPPGPGDGHQREPGEVSAGLPGGGHRPGCRVLARHGPGA